MKQYFDDLHKELTAINTANGWSPIRKRDWKDKYKIPAIIALITSELSEALEGFRKDDKENFAEELADTMIRLVGLSGSLGIDIHNEVVKKLAKNRTRGFRHGGKKV